MEPYTISHTGSVLGAGNVTLAANQTDPQRETAVISFECPKKFNRLQYVGKRDATRFVPRTMQSETFADADASTALEESERTISLAADIQPVAGETELDEQDYPAVRVVNTTQGVEIGHEDLTVDYSANTVVVAESAVAIDDVVKAYPILTEGTITFQGRNSLDQREGVTDKWGFPVYRFHDHKQNQRGREIRLKGSVEWERYEKLEVLLDSPHAIVWEDADYPDSYVSTFEQDVSIEL